jgi:serine/threonine-protein kinase
MPQDICEAGDECRGASWGRRNEIVFAPAPASGLLVVTADGGTPRAATTLDFDQGERTHRWPSLLPDGRHVLLTVARAGSESFRDADIAVASLETGGRRVLLRHATCARYVPTGHLVYMRGGSMMAVPFNADRAFTSGAAVPLIERVMTQPTGSGHFSFAETGLLVYLTGDAQQVRRRLVKLDSVGGVRPLSIPMQAFEEPRLSPDGKQLAIGIRAALNDIWLHDFERGTLKRVTFEADNFAAIWTPDGNGLTFSSNRNGPCQIYWRSLVTDADAQPLVGGDYDLVPAAWTSDGERLIFTEYHPESGADIWMCAPRGATPPQPIVRTAFNEYSPAVSPCDRRLAYTSDDSGRPEVYVAPFPAADRRIQVSTNGGSEPIWSRDGSRLYYRSGSSVISVECDRGDPIVASARRVADGPYLPAAVTGLPNYDVTAEGDFLLIEQEAAQARPDELSVIVDWFAELSRVI